MVNPYSITKNIMQNSIMYNILKSKLHPAYDRFNERERVDNQGAWRVEWEIVGQCNSMAQAVAMGFRGCALEQVK